MLDRITRSSAAAAPLRDSQRDFFQASRSDGLSPQGADSREPSFGRTPDARLRGGRSEGPLRPAPLSPAATNVTVTVQAPPLGVTEYARVFRDPEFQRFLQGAIYQWMNRRSQAY
jgi:hypothetical protein